MKYQKQKLGKNPAYYSNKKNKVSRNKLNQSGKRPFSENYRTLKKEIKEDTNNWKHIWCLWIRIINIIKMCKLPKTIYRFDATPIKISMACFTDLEQIFQKMLWNQKLPRIASAISKKKNRVGGITILISNCITRSLQSKQA